jgi:hypothetical protein
LRISPGRVGANQIRFDIKSVEIRNEVLCYSGFDIVLSSTMGDIVFICMLINSKMSYDKRNKKEEKMYIVVVVA